MSMFDINFVCFYVSISIKSWIDHLESLGGLQAFRLLCYRDWFQLLWRPGGVAQIFDEFISTIVESQVMSFHLEGNNFKSKYSILWFGRDYRFFEQYYHSLSFNYIFLAFSFLYNFFHCLTCILRCI